MPVVLIHDGADRYEGFGTARRHGASYFASTSTASNASTHQTVFSHSKRLHTRSARTRPTPVWPTGELGMAEDAALDQLDDQLEKL